MFRSIKGKFYATALLLVISFSTGYVFLAYFLNQQSEGFIRARDIAVIEKDFIKLNELFHESRFWEKVIFLQNDPEAEMQYGALIEQARMLSQSLNKKELNETITFNLKQIIEKIDQYEKNFNQLIQLKTKQSLISTRMETNFRSMTSIVLMRNNPMLLKPMFNFTHFLITYRSARNLSKYQALNLVINSFEKKIQESDVSDVRIQGYLDSFRIFLSEDYSIKLDIINTNKVVESITNQIQGFFVNISSELETHLKRKIQETTKIKQDLQNIFLLSGLSGILILLFFLYLFLKNIITPVRSIVSVMQKVQTGDFDARFIHSTKYKDDIIQLGLSFNDMLDTLADNNQKILDYQKELEKKIVEITKKKIESKELTEKLHQSQKMESIGTLAGGIAHDFNNILSSIIGFTELALGGAEKGTELEDDLQEVRTAGLRAKDLVKQILTFARQSDEAVKPIQVSIITKEVLKFIKSSIPTTIEINDNLNSDSLIMGSPTQVHQILMNLFTNAAQAMEENGGILGVSLNDTTIDQMVMPELKPGEYLLLKVTDTGKGIPSQNIQSIFEPYFTTKPVGEGTGMGLAVVPGIVENYGGLIAVDSTIGKGTCFNIYLPITKKRKSKTHYEIEDLSLGNERILFVDDEASIAKMGGKILEQLGYSVTTRTSSVEALELFRSKPDAFDLVVTDMTMPNMTGYKMAGELMKIRPGVPVVLCTGYSKKISEVSAKEIGIKAFAYKPIVKAELAKTVRKVLDEANGSE